jgi:D-psicose/D-tagatose/L-ribulose 3-epimerase
MPERHRLAVSNIAWNPSEDEVVLGVLRREGVTGVEIAPTKWRTRPFEASAADIAPYRRYWEDHGLRVVSLQALLFGRPDLQLFGGNAARVVLVDYLCRAIDFSATIGAQALVFGSPRNRVRGELPLASAMADATAFFRELAEYAYARGTVICIEANPVEYGCDFITTTAEAVDLCRAIDHPGVRVNVDLGGITMAAENSTDAIATAGSLIGHVHASEPNLAEIGAASNHEGAAAALTVLGYAGWVSIEMRAAGGNAAAVERALRVAKAAY